MEQHPIPQNVTTFQFRLIGDMTLKQFGYILICALGAYICYRLPLPIIFSLPLAILVAMLGFGLAFVPIEERPMDVWIMSFIKSIYSPTLYVWQREKPVVEPIATPKIKTVPAATNQTNTNQTHTTTVTLPQNPVVQKPQATVVPAIPSHINQSQTPIAKPIDTQKPVANTMEPTQQQTTPPQIKQHEIPAEHKDVGKFPTPPQQSTRAAKHISLFDILFGWLRSKQKNQAHTVSQSNMGKTTTSLPMTPTVVHHTQTHNGGNFMDSLKHSFGVTNHPASPPPANEKNLFANLKTPSVAGVNLQVPGLNSPASKKTDEHESEQLAQSQAETDKIQSKNTELEQKLSNLQSELSTKDMSASRIIELQKQLTEVLSERQNMEAELQTLRTKLSQAQTQTQQPTQMVQPKTYEVPRGPTVKVITAETAVRSGMPMLTTFPNVVTGIIKDVEGILLPGVLVTVRDKEGVPLRALKTNRLGQFAASTPLPNGTYIIEVEDPRSRFVFDRVQITLNGNIAPAVELNAKSQKQLEREKLEKAIFGGPA